MHRPNTRVLIALSALALALRLLWVLWIHPPGEYAFRDMEGYLFNARHLAEHGLTPLRHMAFQAWGTHFLLAIPFVLFGTETLLPAAILWAFFGAAAVPLTYLLACSVCSRPRVATFVGFAALLWYPNIANTGVFLAEAPLLGLLIAATWRMVILIQEGRGSLSCGVACALCFALRPEVAIFFLLSFALWMWVRREHPAARWRHVGIIAGCLMLVLTFSIWHFHHHTRRWGGIAESAQTDLSMARCHHARVQGFKSVEELERDPKAGGFVGVASFGLRLAHNEADSLFALRPVFGKESTRFEIMGGAGPIPIWISNKGISIQLIGHPCDPVTNAAIVRTCIARTGFVGQIHISLINLSGLWFFNAQWPDNSDRGEKFLPWSNAFVTIFQWAVLFPSLLGVYWSIRGARTNPGLALCSLPLVSIMIAAAIWFGEVRIRTPYDPLALLLAAEVYTRFASLAATRLLR